jgi:hypothetical protein
MSDILEEDPKVCDNGILTYLLTFLDIIHRPVFLIKTMYHRLNFVSVLR